MGKQKHTIYNQSMKDFALFFVYLQVT